ncbi:uncharacterized protein LOC143547025 [Bidens hawaiensis]|uniref:uncharacterized protein LOC143547025 n=1 Tax=Bidens hawaiensis TaxID=980011 RepID=UPI00404A3A57
MSMPGGGSGMNPLVSNNLMSNEWMESRIQQNRDVEARRSSESQSQWMSGGTNDDNSKRLLMELLHQKPAIQPTEPLDINSGPNRPFGVGSYGLNPGGRIDDTLEGFKGNEESLHPMNALGAEIHESMLTQQGGFTALHHRNNSLGIGGYMDNIGVGAPDSFSLDAEDRMTATSQRPENILLKRPPVPRAASSHEALSELLSKSDVRGRSVPTIISLEGGRREAGGNIANQVTENTADIRFRRTSSWSEADVAETASFSDMFKSNNARKSDNHASAGALESADGQGGKTGKKKGKKGRQIDPALLGFKVTSNRIMMGEIQRIDD